MKLWNLPGARTRRYGLALLLPALVTLAMWNFHGAVSAANIALIYIVAVIVTAVTSGTRPALVSAIASFLALNISFTEPRGSLIVLNNQDVITAGLFLVVALIVAQLAARLKDHLERLRIQERFSQVEMSFLERLAGSADSVEIGNALLKAVQQISEAKCRNIAIRDNRLDWLQSNLGEPAGLPENLKGSLEINLANPEEQVYKIGDGLLVLLSDGSSAVFGLWIDPAQESIRSPIRLLVNQANLALARTRLSEDLKKEMLEKENELMRSSLLSSISHDFRTPLTSMIGAASTLMELGGQLSEAEKRELLESLLAEARRLNSYTQKLLDMTRLGRGELNLHRTTISINELLNVVLKRIREHFPKRSLVVSLPMELPLLNVHPALIEQALYNVIENACKFTPEDGTIRVSSQRNDENLVIEIEDSGPGVPDEEKTKVFEMFHSADRGDRRMAGSGLGLAISKGMIGAHGGTIEMSDSALGGSLVRISLPAGDGEQP